MSATFPIWVTFIVGLGGAVAGWVYASLKREAQINRVTKEMTKTVKKYQKEQDLLAEVVNALLAVVAAYKLRSAAKCAEEALAARTELNLAVKALPAKYRKLLGYSKEELAYLDGKAEAGGDEDYFPD